MSYNAVTTNLFYRQFRESALPTPFVTMIAARWAICMVGSALNLSLVYVTVRTKSMHGPCNILIASNALCTALFEPSLSIGLYIALSGIQFVPLRTCFMLQAVPSFFGNLTLITMLAIGLDRIISVCFPPLWRLQARTIPYLTVLLSLCTGYALFCIWQTFLITLELPDLLVICSSPGECQQGPIGNFLYQLNVAVNLTLLLEYVVLWAGFKVRQHRLASTEFTRRIIRSLTAITALIMVGWLTNSVVRLYLPGFGLSPLTTAYITFGFSFLPMLAMALNAPTLFVFSYEYRQAYAKQFPRFLHAYAATNYSTATVQPKIQHPMVAPQPPPLSVVHNLNQF